MKKYTYLLLEDSIPKAPAYWIDPIGHILPIFDDEKHIGMILKKPSAFGLDINEIKMLYDAESEQLGDEGRAREKIIKELLQRGWIRIRHYPRQDMFTVNVFQLKKKAKDNLYRWSKAMNELGRKYSQVKIDTPTGVIHSSVGDIANDALFTESKNSKPLIVIKDINDLPELKIESMFHKEGSK